MLSLVPKRRIPFLIADIVLIIFSVVAAFLVRFELSIPARYFTNIEGIIILSLLVTVLIFYFSKLYIFTWEFVSTEEIISLLRATTFSFLIVTASFFVLRDHPVFSGFPRSTLFLSYFFIFIFTGALRFSKRIFRYLSNERKLERKERTLIVGAGGAGEQILRNIINSFNSPYLPVGFIDDNPNKKGFLIHGLKVLGTINDIPQVAKENNIDSLIIAFPSAGSKTIKRAQEQGIKGGIMDIKYMPPMDELISSADEIGTGELRDIAMEDLLGRETTDMSEKNIEEFIRGKKILITGAAGSIGSELARQVARFNPSILFLLDQDETGIFNISQEIKNNFPSVDYSATVADICDEKKMSRLINGMIPDAIFHAAAYKHVPLMEDDPQEAVRNNILGTYILTKIFKDLWKTNGENKKKKFIFISTDKAVNPSSVMGATKRVGEIICQIRNEEAQNAEFISVRFGNVLGSRGSVIPVFKEQISGGGPVKITHRDMNRYFMVTSEACRLVMQAGVMGKGGEVFVLDMGNPIKIIDLARELIRKSGFEPDKDIKIDLIGSRPGEKLFEEILTAEEGTTATQNQKIFIAKTQVADKEAAELKISNLINMIEKTDKKSIINYLNDLVPSYKPSSHVLNNK
jgi:FlaA1/EpsC-like NDP-sugar epimerase